MNRTARRPNGGGAAAAANGAWRSPAVRLVTGLAISAAFLAVTVWRADLGETARPKLNQDEHHQEPTQCVC